MNHKDEDDDDFHDAAREIIGHAQQDLCSESQSQCPKSGLEKKLLMLLNRPGLIDFEFGSRSSMESPKDIL